MSLSKETASYAGVSRTAALFASMAIVVLIAFHVRPLCLFARLYFTGLAVRKLTNASPHRRAPSGRRNYTVGFSEALRAVRPFLGAAFLLPCCQCKPSAPGQTHPFAMTLPVSPGVSHHIVPLQVQALEDTSVWHHITVSSFNCKGIPAYAVFRNPQNQLKGTKRRNPT